MAFACKKPIAITLSLAILLIIFPVPASAGMGFSIDIISVGPLSLGIDIPWWLAGIFIFGSMLVSFFDHDSLTDNYHYSASYPELGVSQLRVSTPPGFSSTVTIHPEDHMRGEPIKIKYNKIIQGGKIKLPGSGYLVIEDDGKLVFTGTSFKGFGYIHYNHSLSIWDSNGEPVLLILPRNDQTFILRERSTRSAEVFEILFGAKPEGKP